MREIKFRCWNARSCMMFFDLGETLPEPAHNYYIGQYTGLLDKNGVEIYEGDILDTPNGYSKVEWETGCFWLEFDSKVPGGWVPERIDKYSPTCVGDDKLIDLKVIGNIHENPELLK